MVRPTVNQREPTVLAESAETSPSDKQQLRKRLLEMIVKREAQRRAPPRAAGQTA